MELIVFNCPKCNQELEVESTGAGEEIECPSCQETIVIPAANSPLSRRVAVPGVSTAAAPEEPSKWGGPVVNAIASSAAAKVERHLKVPIHDTPQEQLIAKPLRPLEAAAKDDGERKIRVKTIRHIDCVEVGHDKFDHVASEVLEKIGEANVVSITTINYSTLDISTQKLVTDYGILVVYRG